MADSDPFIVVKEEVEQSVGAANTLYTKWTAMYESAQCDMAEFEHVTNELRTNLKSIEWDLEDLDETITIVEQSPDRFKITMDEIRRRKQFILDTRARVTSLRQETSEKKSKGKAAEQDRAVSEAAGAHNPSRPVGSLDTTVAVLRSPGDSPSRNRCLLSFVVRFVPNTRALVGPVARHRR